MSRNYASCVNCYTVLPVAEMVFAPVINRGGRHSYLCPACTRRVDGYSASTSSKGKEKSELWTVSEELETNWSSPTGRANLLQQGFRPTHDSSLGASGVEYKSPVYKGFGGIVRYQKSVEKLYRLGELEMDNRCGHHLHIGRESIEGHLGGEAYDIDAKRLDTAWKYRTALLLPLADYLEANPTEARLVFGRELCGYAAHPRNAWHTPRREHDNRYAYINLCTEGKVQADDFSPERRDPALAKTVEFRLNKFINADQYSRLIMMEKAMVQALITHFWDYAAAGVPENVMRAQAKKTGQKLVDIFRKTVVKAEE